MVFLEGYDIDWVLLGNVVEVCYNNLFLGKYCFYVWGVGFSGIFLKNIIELDVYVKEFFYKSVWFYLLFLLVGMVLIVVWISCLCMEKLCFKVEVEKCMV